MTIYLFRVVLRLAPAEKELIELKYNKVIAKYLNAEPATGRIARQIEAPNEIANQSLTKT